LKWSVAELLKDRSTNLGWGMLDAAVPEALEILRSEFDVLNDFRAKALSEYTV